MIKRQIRVHGHILFAAISIAAVALASCETVQKPQPMPAQVNPKADALADQMKVQKFEPPPEVKPQVPPAAPGTPPVDTTSTTEPANYQILRYVGVDASDWDQKPASQSYPDFYTSVWVYTQVPAAGVGGTGDNSRLRDYTQENRSVLARLVSSKTNSVTAVANVSVTNPTMTIALPLFSVTHASGLQLGNTWGTNFTGSSVESPLFLISSNTRLTIHLDAKISSDMKSQAASLVLQAVSSAVKIAAPSSALLTPLSSTDVSNKATAIDSAVSSLLSQDISEDIEEGRLANSWTTSSVIKIYGCAPFVRTEGSTTGEDTGRCASDVDLDGHTNTPVGIWFMRLACPRPSAFDPRDICSAIGSSTLTDDKVVDVSTAAKLQAVNKIIADQANDAQVLKFGLSSQVDVRTFVQSQQWFTTFVGVKTKAASDFDNFCSGGIGNLEENGLSKLDAAIVIRAAVRQMPQLADAKADFAAAKNGANCVALLTASGVDF